MRSIFAVLAALGFAAAGGGCWALWPNIYGILGGCCLLVLAFILVLSRDAEFERDIDALEQANHAILPWGMS